MKAFTHLNFLAITLIGFFAVANHVANSQNRADRFIVDGNLSDFKQVPHQHYTDTSQQPDSGINLQQVYMTHDEDYFYLGFTSERKLNLTGGKPRQGQVYIYLDIDRKRKTGYLTGGLGGDFSIDFTRKIVRWNREPETTIQLDQAGVRVMPTLSAKTYEVAIARTIAMEADTVRLDGTIDFQLSDERTQETLPAYDSTFTYTFGKPRVEQPAPLPLSKAPEADLRVVSHNTLDNGLTNEKRAPVLSRLYQTLNPDVLALNECWEVSAAKAKRFFNQNLQLEGDKAWQAVKLDEGNITVSRYPIAEQWQIADEMRLTATQLAHPSGPLLLINAHLSCCDQNDKRKAQAKALMAFLAEAHQEGGRLDLAPGTPIIVAGDMNLVGEGQTLRMLTGDTTMQQTFKPDWDYTPLQAASNPHTHGHFNYTWKSLETGWPAGKLDYVLYTSSVLKPARAYTLNTSVLPDSLLSQLALKANATDRASDHYPLVTDFTVGESSGSSQPGFLPGKLGHSSYSFNLDPAVQQVNIYDRQGKAVYDQNADQPLQLDLTQWKTGVYYAEYRMRGASPQVESFMVGP